MGDRRSYTYRNGQRVERTSSGHLGDGKTTLCCAEARGRWEVTIQAWYGSRLCRECEAIRDRMRLEKLERRQRPRSIPNRSSRCSTLITHGGGGETIRRKGWHLGNGTTTLCGITRPKWSLPERRPRTRACGVCQKVAGLDSVDSGQALASAAPRQYVKLRGYPPPTSDANSCSEAASEVHLRVTARVTCWARVCLTRRSRGRATDSR